MGLVISECKGLYGQLQGEGGEDGEAVEVSKHQVPVLVAAEDLVVGRDEASYPVAGRLAHLIKSFFKEEIPGWYVCSPSVGHSG